MTPIFNDIQKKKADFIMANKHAKLSSLVSSEIKDLAVVWCYYSGKIEGNTYTYVETEALLKDNITSEKRYEDAKMLKNLYNTFVSETLKEFISDTKWSSEKCSHRPICPLGNIVTDFLLSAIHLYNLNFDAVLTWQENPFVYSKLSNTSFCINRCL